MKQDNSNSFLTGFSWGLITGAVGYFLFGTDQGKKVRDEISEEWQKSKEKLAEEGVIEDKNISIREWLGSVVAGLNTDKKLEVKNEKIEKKTSSKSSKSSRSKTVSKGKKFKGV